MAEALLRLNDVGLSAIAEDMKRGWPSHLYWPFLLVTLICYVIFTQVAKMWLLKKAWI